MRESVVLPAPDGEDRTSIRPRRAIVSFGADRRDAVALPADLPADLRPEAFLPPVGFRPVFVRSVFARLVLAAGALAILKPPKRLRPRVAGALPEHDLFPKPVSTFRDHALFQILHLLAKLLDHRLQLEPDIG